MLYGFLPRLVEVWSRLPQVGSIGWMALGVLALCQFASWWCSAELDRAVLPGVSHFEALATSLVTNAISHVVPAAGGAIGVGLSYQMWEDVGVEAGDAKSAVGATTVLSLATLFVLPVVTLGFAFTGVSVPS